MIMNSDGGVHIRTPVSKRHHYVPQFLIKNWANENGLVRVWRRVDGKLTNCLQQPKNVMAQNHLYRLKRVEAAKQGAIESAFARIEGRAGEALSNMLSAGGGELSLEQKKQWALLVMAIRARIPSRMERIKNTLDEPQYAELKAILEERGSDYVHDYFLQTMIRSAGNADALQRLLAMQWSLGTFENMHPFLLGDNPIIIEGFLLSDQCVLSFPVTPKHIFVAASNRQLHDNVLRLDGRKVVETLNRVQARESHRELVGSVEVRFLEKHFCQK